MNFSINLNYSASVPIIQKILNNDVTTNVTTPICIQVHYAFD